MIRIEKRLSPSPAHRVFSPVVSILSAFLFGALFLKMSGFEPLQVYRVMILGAFGDLYGCSETLVKAIPIALCALGVAVAFRMSLWNIGAEGQFLAGAAAATWVAISFPGAPALVLLPGMAAAALAAGGLWALLAAVPRAFLQVNEIITTLMLNYVALYGVEYLIYGPWRDPAAFQFPLSVPFAGSARLPLIGGTRIHAGLFFALGAAGLLAFLSARTRWGFEMRVIGDSPETARYAGINLRAHVIAAICAGGALAGLAGMSEVSAITGRLQHGLSPGYGYTAIIVAWLANLNPWGILVASVLFGGLLVGGYSVQFVGVPAAAVYMLQGAMLFFLLAADFIGRYRLTFSIQTAQRKEA